MNSTVICFHTEKLWGPQIFNFVLCIDYCRNLEVFLVSYGCICYTVMEIYVD